MRHLALVLLAACTRSNDTDTDVDPPDTEVPDTDVADSDDTDRPDTDLTECVGDRFYVSPTGSDAGDGSERAPFATLAHAASVVTSPGSTIELTAGTFLEAATVELAPQICLEGAGVDATTVRSTVTADWTPIVHATSPEGTDGHQHISDLTFDGSDLATFWAIEVAGRSNVSIHDVRVVDFKDRGVLMNGRADNVEAPPGTYATGLMFYRNTISNSSLYDGYGRGSLCIGGTEGMLIFENVLIQDQRPIGSNGWLIKGSNEGYNKGLKIYRNHFTKIPFTGAYAGDGGWDFAVEMFHDQGTEFYENVVDGGGFDTNHQSRGDYEYSVWIHDNAFSLPEIVNSNNTAVTLEFSTDGAIVENNTIDRMSNCFLFTPRDGDVISDTVIAGNLCTNVSKGAGDGSNADFLNMAPGGTNYSVDGLVIVNNTLLADPENRPWWGLELGAPTVGTVDDVLIANNILTGTVTGAIVGGGNLGRIEIRNNDMWDNEQTNEPVWPDGAPADLEVSGSLHVPPGLASDYRLADDSPLIDAGTDVGRSYEGSAPDVGCFEHAR